MAATSNTECPQCGSQLRAPADRGTLTLRCPSCRHEFAWTPRSHSTTNGEIDKEALALLRESVTPEVYHRNGFRVLELPVDATNKDINRRKQMMEMATSNGVPLPPGSGRCFPLDPTPDEFTVRDAVQRLGDPERRLVDEFFWFWPHEPGQSKSDQGLQHLIQGNHERALEIWSQQEANRSVSHVSTHNLAVLHHLLALQWENKASSCDLTGDERKNIEQLWSRAFRRWRKLLDEEAFWSRLTSRVREFEDPRLTAGTVRRLRNALPAALLSINALLALQAVERGRKDSAARLVNIIRQSGFPDGAVQDGLRQAVEPIRARIKALCKAAEQSAEADPAHADSAGRQLLDTAIPLLDGLDRLLPTGDPTRDVAHDDVAERALQCVLSFAKKTQNWKASIDLLEWAAVIAASKSVSKVLQENFEIVKKNAEAGDDFCGEGYYDLPTSVLEQIEAARKLAEAHDYGAAIARLDRLLRRIHPIALLRLVKCILRGGKPAGENRQAVPIVSKALAYCLGCRALRVWNEALDEWNAFEPSVIKKIRDRIDEIDEVTWTCANDGKIPADKDARCMADGTLITGRFNLLKWTFKDDPIRLIICEACGERYESERNSGRHQMQRAVQLAAQELVDAGQLDPENNFVKKQIERCHEMFSEWKLLFPSACSAARRRFVEVARQERETRRAIVSRKGSETPTAVNARSLRNTGHQVSEPQKTVVSRCQTCNGETIEHNGKAWCPKCNDWGEEQSSASPKQKSSRTKRREARARKLGQH